VGPPHDVTTPAGPKARSIRAAMNSVAAAPGLEVQRRRVSAEAGAYRLQAPLPPPALVGLRGAAVVRRDGAPLHPCFFGANLSTLISELRDSGERRFYSRGNAWEPFNPTARSAAATEEMQCIAH
jgi:hypothetical protein